MKIRKYKIQKKRRNGLTLIGLFALITALNISFISIVPTVINEINENDENKEIEENDINPIVSAIKTSPIHVADNWSDTIDTYWWCSGQGYAWDPYIIENVEIDASGSSFAGIRIENSNKYFIIRNSIIYNAGSFNFGIDIINAYNGVIENCTLYNNDNAIHLQNSNNTEVRENIIYDNGGGIVSDQSGESTFQSNNITSSGIGITITNSYYNTISNNYIANSYTDGMFIQNSHSNIVTQNTIYNQSAGGMSGIYFDQCSYNTIEDNNITKCFNGIQVTSNFGSGWQNNILKNNIIDSLSRAIMIVDNSNDNIIRGNNIRNATDGVYVRSSFGNTISHNTIEQCDLSINIESQEGQGTVIIMILPKNGAEIEL